MKDEKYGLGETSFTQDQLDELMSPTLAEERARKRKFDETLMGIFTGDSEDFSGPYKLRTVVESESWLIPLTDAGKPLILNVKKGEHEKLFASISKKDGRRTDREGNGGQLLPVLQNKMGNIEHYKQVNGRELARSIPKGITGLLVEWTELESNSLRELDKEHFHELSALADAIEIEDKLMNEIFVDVEAFKKYSFLVMLFKNKLWMNDNVAQIATYEDSYYLNDSEVRVERMDGSTIISKVLADSDYCGIVVNPGYEVGRKGENKRGLLLSMHHIKRLARNEVGPYRVKEYVTRSREEFELWLEQTFFPTPYEIVEEKDSSGKIFLHAVSHAAESKWESIEFQNAKEKNYTETPKFELRLAPGNPDELAAGTSSILCPALLARRLFVMLPQERRRDYKWLPGKSFGLGRLLSEQDITNSKLRVRLANEILKLMPAAAESIERTSMLTVDGASFMAWGKDLPTRTWIESARDQSKKFDKKLVMGV